MSRYLPVPPSALVTEEFAVPLGEYLGWQFDIHVRFARYRGQVRDFSVGLWAFQWSSNNTLGDRYEVASVDCCDSQIHVHRLRRSAPADRNADRRIVVELAAGDAPIVDAEYPQQYDWMVDQWQALARSWHDG